MRAKRRYADRAMPVMLLVVFIDLVGFGLVLPLLPFYGQFFGASPFLVALLLGSFSGMQLLSAPLWGRLSDRIGRRPVILVSLLTSVLAYLWLGCADALWMLFAARALQGISAGNISVAQAYIADTTTPESRAKGMGMLGAGIGLGFVLGPAIGGEIAGHNPDLAGVAHPFFAAAGLSALALVLAAVFLRESLPPDRRANPTLQPGRIAMIVDAFSRPRLRQLMLVFFTTTLAFAAMESTMALAAHQRFGWGPEDVGRLFMLIGLVMVLVQGGLVGRLSRRFGETRLLQAGTLGIALGLALLAIVQTGMGGVVASLLLATGIALSSPSTAALISRAAGATEQGGIQGVNQSLGSLGRVVGPIIGGAAFDWAGPKAPFVIGSLIMILAIALALRLVAPVQEAQRVGSIDPVR